MTDTDPARMPPWRFQEWADAEIAKADAAKRAEKPDPSRRHGRSVCGQDR